MNADDNQEKKPQPVFLNAPQQKRRPYPYEKKLNIMGKITLGYGLFFLLLGALFVSNELTRPPRPLELNMMLSYISAFLFGALYVVVGIVSMLCGARKTLALKRALQILCALLILSSIVMCIIFYQVDKDLMVCGMPGFVMAPALWKIERMGE